MHNRFGGDQEAKKVEEMEERRDREEAGWKDDSSAQWNILTNYNWNC